MATRTLATDVFTMALKRLRELYAGGDRVVVSFSSGKDSGVVLELAIIAARAEGKLPVDVVMRDEEILFPGSFEYAERVRERPEVRFHWFVARQPIVNIYNRAAPYFWAFDPLLDPAEWVRPLPPFAVEIDEKHIQGMIVPDRFPPAPGKRLITVMGLRAAESSLRRMGIFSSRGFVTKENEYGTSYARPIYDWSDGDVWRAVKENGWDYNHAYDSLFRLGLSKSKLRIAPPTLSAASLDALRLASYAWPVWFDRVVKRLPGTRQAVNFGKRAIEPDRRQGETWEECFKRACLGDSTPAWIQTRAAKIATKVLSAHARHSTQEFPQVALARCCGLIGSWRSLCRMVYSGDPFGMKTGLKPVEPEFFRVGAGAWGGKPTW